jgi:hypothetical protein
VRKRFECAALIPILVCLGEAAPIHPLSSDLVELQAMQSPEMQAKITETLFDYEGISSWVIEDWHKNANILGDILNNKKSEGSSYISFQNEMERKSWKVFLVLSIKKQSKNWQN